MARRQIFQRLLKEDLKYLFPHEIIANLDKLVATIPVDLSHPVEPPAEQDARLDLLGEILDHIESRPEAIRKTETYVPLSKESQDYLAHWLLQARRKAYRQLEKQPETPLGFHPDQRCLLSNILQGNWYDATDGGQESLKWEILD